MAVPIVISQASSPAPNKGRVIFQGDTYNCWLKPWAPLGPQKLRLWFQVGDAPVWQHADITGTNANQYDFTVYHGGPGANPTTIKVIASTTSATSQMDPNGHPSPQKTFTALIGWPT
jgi:hypothetical protein